MAFEDIYREERARSEVRMVERFTSFLNIVANFEPEDSS
jgi:hypothetical protein